MTPPSRQLPFSRATVAAVVSAFPLALLALCLTPYAHIHRPVAYTLVASATLFLIWIAGLVLTRRDRPLTVVFNPIRSHYVQAIVQGCIYASWGWYWRPLYEHAPLIGAQLLFVYGLDALVSLTRRRSWTLGFGPFPIVLSTNFFLLFRPDWFALQFVMNGLGVLGKEFIRWQRDGRNTHIFNPSALGLFVVSLAVLITGTTHLTWGEEIAITLNNPPHIYLQIFVLGLIVQAFFSVTLVTLWAVIALVGLNLAYTTTTGVFFFLDSNIPIAVFLGLHLLVTDPATSPRTNAGRALFGALYGAGVFALFGVLSSLDAPTFYDKLLCVPALNLLVPVFDRLGNRARTAAIWPAKWAAGNWVHMAIWIAVFSAMYATGFVGPGHKGTQVAFWKSACSAGLRNGCDTLVRMEGGLCRGGDAASCLELGTLHAQTGVQPDPLLRGQALALGCDLGYQPACLEFERYARLEDGTAILEASCAKGVPSDCYIVGLVYKYGIGRPPDSQIAIDRWSTACSPEWPRACAELGALLFFGNAAVSVDVERALKYLDLACQYHDAASCSHLGAIYRQGRQVAKNPDRAALYLAKACENGLQPACQ